MSRAAKKLEYIPASKLVADLAVQRSSLDEARVARMADRFDIDLVGVLEVSRRDDGSQHVLDGMHRTAAARAADLGDIELPCLVWEGLTRAEEAHMFLGLNNAKGVNAVDRFRVRVVAEDPAAVALDEILALSGWTVKAGTADGYFMAVGALEALWNTTPTYGRSNAQIVDKTIRILTEAWGRQPDTMRSQIVTGIGSMVLRYGDTLNTSKLVSVLALYSGGPRKLVGDARTLRSFRRGRVGDSVAEILVREVNRGVRKANKLASWRDEDGVDE
jgi:hypothetical protein